MWTRFLSALLCFVLVASTTGSRGEVIVITRGQNALVVTTNNGTFLTSQVADRVIDLNGGDQPPPPPPPPDGSLQELSARWKTLVPDYAKRDAHRLALSALHSALVTRIASGDITGLDQLSTQTRQLRDLFLADDKDKWSDWASPIGERLSRITTLSEMRSAYEQIARGLSEGEALSPAILVLIELILDILEERGVNPRLLQIVQIVLSLLSGLGAEDQLEESSLPDPSEGSSRGGQSARYSGGGQGLVAVRPGAIDLRTRRW